MKWRVWLAVLVIVVAAAVVGLIMAPIGEDRPDIRVSGNIEQGEHLLQVGGCFACHTRTEEDDASAFAGGHELDTAFGSFFAPNITSSESHGIGGWSLNDFEKALRQGVSPEGHAYYPAFPFLSYRSLTDEDVAHLYAALMATEPVDEDAAPHQVRFPFNIRLGLKPWRWLFATTKSLNIDQSTALGRGRYLVDAVAHCGECHNPRNSLGAFIPPYLGGNDRLPGGNSAPPIHGRALSQMDWNELDLMYFLSDGMLPNGDFVGGSMVEAIDYGTAYMSESDRRAMAEYLFSLQ